MTLEQRRRYALATDLYPGEGTVIGQQIAARRAIGLEHSNADIVLLDQNLQVSNVWTRGLSLN